jgi:hypothetical protein
MFLEDDAGPNVAIILVCEFAGIIIFYVNQLSLKETHPIVSRYLIIILGDSKIAHEAAMQRSYEM